jgi:uncharacterized protein YndB with AHSA1/START domain
MEQPIVVEQSYAASPAVVWRAITDPRRMQQWFFPPIRDFAATIGHESRFAYTHEGVDYAHRWTVLEVMPERRLVYRWRYDGIAGDSMVAWDLAPTATGTTLTLTHTGHETFPREPTFSREAGEAGWSYFVRDSLAAFLTRVEASCHCGGVLITVPEAPAQLTSCNCTLCRRLGGLWSYYSPSKVRVIGATTTYRWGDNTLDTHRCTTCGCVTHWSPLDPSSDRMGVNARLMDPAIVTAARVRRIDGADTWAWLD